MVEELIKSLLGELKDMIKTDTVMGTPVKAGEAVIIPISHVAFGFGAGGGGGKDQIKGGEGQGVGAGVNIEPLAFIVVTPEGKAQLLPLSAKEATFGKIIDMIPSVLSTVKEWSGREKKKETA